MKFLLYSCMFVIAAALAANPVLADSNASGGDTVNSETVSIGAGPYDHGAAVGNSDNTVVTGVLFTGGFNATHVRFTGTATSVLAATWGSEADIQIRNGVSSYNWQNPGPNGTFSTYDYDFAPELTGDFAGGVDPGTGTWDLEFFDTFDDGPGVDAQSTNVDMIFEEQSSIVDNNGTFSLGSLNNGDTNTSLGEFAQPSLLDFYAITLNEAGLFSFFTDEDPTGFVGNTVDTEIGIFDSLGLFIAEDDDSGNGLYSGIFDLLLPSGDYTLAVTPYLSGTSFADGFIVNPGTGTGDYIISASLVSPEPVPEPATMLLLGTGLVGVAGAARRKKKNQA